MDKEHMQQAIIEADKKGQKKKRKRMISYMIFFAICTFAQIRKYNPEGILEDLLSSILLGSIIGFIVPMALSFYYYNAGIQLSFPEDRELEERLLRYRRKFGEDFYGPWTN